MPVCGLSVGTGDLGGSQWEGITGQPRWAAARLSAGDTTLKLNVSTELKIQITNTLIEGALGASELTNTIPRS